MTQIILLNDKLAVAPQIHPEQIAQLVQLGYQQIISNRPDGEEPPYQPNIADIQTAAEEHGVNVVFAPVCNGQFSRESIDLTEKALANEQKTLMYCRSGLRCGVLWAIVQVRSGEPIEHVLAQLRHIGFDINHLRNLIITSAAP